jgi:hypothetical protein
LVFKTMPSPKAASILMTAIKFVTSRTDNGLIANASLGPRQRSQMPKMSCRR